jgi:glycerol uptake facilitator-like aquaporin
MLAPSPQWPWWQAGLGETLMTTVLILLIFVCLSRPNLVRWTAWVAALVIALCIWLAGSYTGACLNPARIFGPALISGVYGGIFFYSVFPFLGSFCAVAIWQLGGNHRLLTSKLVHDAAYATTMATHLPTAPHP